MKHQLISATQIMMGITFIYAGLYKFFPVLPVPAFIEGVQQRVMEAFSDVPWVMPLLASVEIVGGILLLFSKTRAFAAVMLLPVITGILMHNLVVDPVTLPVALIVVALEVWLLVRYRRLYMHVFHL